MAEKPWNPKVVGNDGPAPYASHAIALRSQMNIILAFVQERPRISALPIGDQHAEVVDLVAKVMLDRSTALGLLFWLQRHLEPELTALAANDASPGEPNVDDV